MKYPFLQQGYWQALEETGAVGPGTGWQPDFVQQPDLLMPLYQKSHSRGEYVFDFAWAEGYYRAGLAYYPKLISAIPFTPVSGPRWLSSLSDPAEKIWSAVQHKLEQTGASGWHLLFPDAAARQALAALPLVSRQACHFQWLNRDYASFEDFLGALVSRKRKNLRRERQRVAEQGLRIVRARGDKIPAHWWPLFYQCYALTYLQRGQQPYLGPDFFARLAERMGDQLLMVVALRDDKLVASALYLVDDQALYGRYWGALEPLDCLHFELCYYQGIEYCIETGLQRFDPGVQGEHKLLRGFEPVITWSLHWLRDHRFQQANKQFCAEEGQAVQQYRDSAREYLPYRRVSAG